MPDGRIVRALLDQYLVNTGNGKYKCSAKGLFRLQQITPLVGDAVLIDILDENDKQGQITRIFKRKNELIRPKAANVDQVCVVFSHNRPRPDFLLIDKVIASSVMQRLTVVVCENKIDLCDERSFEQEMKGYGSAGIPTVRISAQKNINMDELALLLAKKTTILAGQSGVGKSSMINSLKSKELMETGEISKKNNRGKHTTRHAELIELENEGYIIDTPGFSNHDLPEMRAEELKLYYPEFDQKESECRFLGCLHLKEPGCAIKQAVSLQMIGAGRYERYTRLYDILKEKEINKYK